MIKHHQCLDTPKKAARHVADADRGGLTDSRGNSPAFAAKPGRQKRSSCLMIIQSIALRHVNLSAGLAGR
jgi:hypothetical protein